MREREKVKEKTEIREGRNGREVRKIWIGGICERGRKENLF